MSKFVFFHMTKEKVVGLICCCLFLGWIALAAVIGTFDMLSLKISSEEVNGSIDEIQRNQVAGRGFSYKLICSFKIDGKSYERWIPVTDIFPFVELIYNEYQRGSTVFLVNQDGSNFFPKYRINLELRRRLYRLVIFIALLVLSIKVIIAPPKETPSINIKNRKCRMCNTVYTGELIGCPSCGSSLYEETNESIYKGTGYGEQGTGRKEQLEVRSEQGTDINLDDKKAEIDRLEKLFDATTDENEKSLIAKQLYELGVMYYWRFMPCN